MKFKVLIFAKLAATIFATTLHGQTPPKVTPAQIKGTFTDGQMLKSNGTDSIQAATNLRENGDTVVVEKILNVDSSFIVRNNEFEVHTRGSSDSRPAVAIGFSNSTPLGFKLEVSDTTTGSSTLRLNNDNTGGGLFLTKGGTAIMFNGSADTWTGSGSTNDAALGAYQSNLKLYTNNSGALKAQLDASGNFYALGDISGASITDRSDIRLKENIYNYNNGLNDVLSLNPVYYNLKDNPNKQRLGFIAQDVRDIIPQAITGNEDDGFLGITYGSITAVLTKAIQEQQAIIESQATEIEQLKTQIQLILNEIEQIKNN